MATSKDRTQWRVKEYLNPLREHIPDFDKFIDGLMDTIFPQRVESLQQMMITALAEVMIMDIGLNATRLGHLASDLLKSGILPDTIRAIYGEGGVWYSEDYRGKQGEPPNESGIRGTIKKLHEMPNKSIRRGMLGVEV